MIKSKLIERKLREPGVNVRVVRATTWRKVEEIMTQLLKQTVSKKLENCNSKIKCKINIFKQIKQRI